MPDGLRLPPPSRTVIITNVLRDDRRSSRVVQPCVDEGMWMVRAAGPAAGMAVPRMVILAFAIIGMFVAVMLLVLGMSRRGTRPLPGHRIRARTRHNHPGARPQAAAARRRAPAPRPPAAPLSLRPSAQRPAADPLSPRPSGRRPAVDPLGMRPLAQRPAADPLSPRSSGQRPAADPLSLWPSARGSQDRADRTESFGYGHPSRWGDEPDDLPGWP